MNQMRHLPIHVSPELWLAQLFSTKPASRGAVVRRSVAWVEREIGRERLIAEVTRRGWHMIENGGRFLILCNREGVKIVC